MPRASFVTPAAVTSLPITRSSRGALACAALRSSPSFWSTICDSSRGRKKNTTTASATAVTAKNSSARRFRMERRGRTPDRLPVPEVVADPAHGEDQLGLLRVLLDLLAQVADVNVDRARIAVGGVAPQALEQHRAAEHAARGARQDREDLELDIGELDLGAAHLDLALAEVDS